MDFNNTKKIKPRAKRKKNPLFEIYPMAKFNPDTGEKVADTQPENPNTSRKMALFEAMADAKRSRTEPVSKQETAKDSITGSGLGLLAGHVIVGKDSNKLKWLTAGRKKGLIALGGAALSGVASVGKQLSEYNRQQGSREMLSGKQTDRSLSYKKALEKKYGLK